MYDALYSPNIGLCGYRCRVGACRRVVRTYKGIVMHCKRVHGLVAQMKLFDAPVQAENQDGVMIPMAKEAVNGEAKTAEQLELIRAARRGEACFDGGLPAAANVKIA